MQMNPQPPHHVVNYIALSHDRRRRRNSSSMFPQHKIKSSEACTLLWSQSSNNSCSNIITSSPTGCDSTTSSTAASTRRSISLTKSLSPSILRKKSPMSSSTSALSSPSSSQQHKRPSIRKTVSFGTTKCYSVPRIEKQDDINATWYNRNEYNAIKKNIQHTAKLIRQSHGGPVSDDEADVEEELCTRGLELQAFPMIRRRRYEEITKSLDAVLSLQERMTVQSKTTTTSCCSSPSKSSSIANSTINANLLAQMYKARTYQSQAAAQRAAMIDAKNVEQIWNNTPLDQQQQETTPTSPVVSGRDVPPKLPQRRKLGSN